MTAATCQLISGVLLPRPCEKQATGACKKCNRQVCAAHAQSSEVGLLCLQCADPDKGSFLKGLELPEKIYFTAEDVAAFAAREPEGGEEPWLDFT